MHADRAERIQNLWGSFDLISAELVKAKRALREGRATAEELAWLREERQDIANELLILDEVPDMTEPGGI